MHTMHESRARSQMTARPAEVQQRRRCHQLARSHRISRQAEQAARQARTALAGAL